MRVEIAARPARGYGGGWHQGPLRFLREHTALLLLLLLVAGGAWLSDVFLTPRNLLNILWAVSILGIVCLGQTVLLITAQLRHVGRLRGRVRRHRRR